MRNWFARHRRRTSEAPLDCHEVAETLQRYLDGDIDAYRARRIEAHLEHCRRCGMELAVYLRIKVTLAAHREQVPGDSVQRLRQFAERLDRGEQLPHP